MICETCSRSLFLLAAVQIVHSSCACAAALDQLTANDPFDQQLAAVLSPALGPLFSAISRTPAISNAIASALGTNSTVVSSLKADLKHRSVSWLRDASKGSCLENLSMHAYGLTRALFLGDSHHVAIHAVLLHLHQTLWLQMHD